MIVALPGLFSTFFFVDQKKAKCVCLVLVSLGAFRAFVQFALVWSCLSSLHLGVWERLRFVIVALPGLFSTLFFVNQK